MNELERSLLHIAKHVPPEDRSHLEYILNVLGMAGKITPNGVRACLGLPEIGKKQ